LNSIIQRKKSPCNAWPLILGRRSQEDGSVKFGNRVVSNNDLASWRMVVAPGGELEVWRATALPVQQPFPLSALEVCLAWLLFFYLRLVFFWMETQLPHMQPGTPVTISFNTTLVMEVYNAIVHYSTILFWHLNLILHIEHTAQRIAWRCMECYLSAHATIQWRGEEEVEVPGATSSLLLTTHLLESVCCWRLPLRTIYLCLLY